MPDTKTPSAVPPVMADTERSAAIARALDGETRGHYAPFRGAYRELPVVRIDPDFLVYRADNGRLIAEVEERFAGDEAAIARFRSGEATSATQSALHQMLVAKARDEKGPILQELERLKQQTEPLLVTGDGVVVNGNRRLAAMRELRARDPQVFSMFCEVHAAVLPADTTPADMELAEAALQMAPETKLAYGWINRRLKMRDQRVRLAMSQADLAEAYRIEPAEIAREAAELDLAEAYLQWSGAPGRYSLISDAEPLFRGLATVLPEIEAGLRDLWRQAGFAMIEARAEKGGDPAAYLPFVAPNPGYAPRWLMVNFAVERGLAPSEDESGAVSPQMHQALASALSQKAQAASNARTLMSLADTLRVVHHNKEAPDRLVRQVRGARRTIENIKPQDLSEEQTRKLRSEIAAIQAHASFLLDDEAPPLIRNPAVRGARDAWRTIKRRVAGSPSK